MVIYLYCVMYFVPVNIMNSSAIYIVALNDASAIVNNVFH